MPVKYILFDPIKPEPHVETFFSEVTTTTREACDDFARKITGAEVSPVTAQGTCSYTVSAATDTPLVVQFRKDKVGSSEINLKLYNQARQVYGEFVAECEDKGEFGDLKVYVFEEKPGVTGIEHACKSTLSADEERIWHGTLAKDFAKFFAAAWKNPLSFSPQGLKVMRENTMTRLDNLQPYLPPQYISLMDRVTQIDLFDGTYPISIEHGDLGILNIMVDSTTGNLHD